MIYIDISKVTPDQDWLKKAEELKRKLIDAVDDNTRKTIIKSNEQMWKEIKSWLLEQSHGKCWYSEAKEICSDYHVDHFRPKSNAKQLDGTPRNGYWWLAFDWTNYRISGSICNSPHTGDDGETYGKHDYFPLREGSKHALNYQDDLRDEIYYLLDPTDPDDPMLISFDETGIPIPTHAEGSWDYKRAEVTIKLLHLKYKPLVDERRKVWQECYMKIIKAKNLKNELNTSESQNRRRDLKETFESIREMIRPTAELSSTARACLLSSGEEFAIRLALSI